MNMKKLQKLRKEGAPSMFMRDVIDALLEDDEPPRIDRSLRGPVEVTNEDGTVLMYAEIWGLFIYADHRSSIGDCSWEDAENRDWTVRPLTPEDIGAKVRRWDEWTQQERDGYLSVQGPWDMLANKAIDIATRTTP